VAMAPNGVGACAATSMGEIASARRAENMFVQSEARCLC
jgi:hypothetical protein